MVKLIDSHCHLNFDYGEKDVDQIIAEAEAAGVDTLINVCTEMKHIGDLEKLSDAHPRIFHTVGVHPHDTKDIEDGDLDVMKKACGHSKCMAVGEIGLDFHYDHSPRDVQRRQLEAQLELALDVGLPVVIHARSAEDDLVESFTRYVKKLPAGKIPGVIHCFSGTQEFGQACIDLGFYLSFSGILTFKNSEPLREAARAYPMEKLMVETDSPFLAPVPLRGKKCEPSMVVHTAKLLAQLKGLALEEVIRVTRANTVKAFSLPFH